MHKQEVIPSVPLSGSAYEQPLSAEAAPGGSTVLSSKPPACHAYPTAGGRTGSPSSHPVGVIMRLPSSGTHVARHSSAHPHWESGACRAHCKTALCWEQFLGKVTAYFWSKERKDAIFASSFYIILLWGPHMRRKGKNNCKQTKRERGGWAQIRLISLGLFCMFIFNLGLATSKFT